MDQFAGNQSPVAGDTTIIEQYPMPLARAWQRVLIASPRPAFHHQQLLVAAETTTYYLGAVAIAAYEQFQAEGGAAAPALNRSLRNLRRPTFGQWLGWVREALAAVPPTADLVPGLAAAYDTPDTGMLLLAYESLRALLVVQLGYSGEYGPRETVSPRLLLELVNVYQLRRATHALPPDSGFEEMAVVAVLAPGLRAVFNRLGLLAAYPLLGLVRRAGVGVEIVRLQGLDAGVSTVELDPAADPPGSLLLANPEELPTLVLDPWLIYAECPECGQVQVAAFAGQQGDTRHYHGLECEHNWVQGLDLVLAEVEATADEPAPGWTPGVADLPGDVPTDQQARMFAALDAEAAAFTVQRRAGRTVAADPVAAPASDAAGHTEAGVVYLDLLAQRAAGGLTLDQLQTLDAQRAADAQRPAVSHDGD